MSVSLINRANHEKVRLHESFIGDWSTRNRTLRKKEFSASLRRQEDRRARDARGNRTPFAFAEEFAPTANSAASMGCCRSETDRYGRTRRPDSDVMYPRVPHCHVCAYARVRAVYRCFLRVQIRVRDSARRGAIQRGARRLPPGRLLFRPLRK